MKRRMENKVQREEDALVPKSVAAEMLAVCCKTIDRLVKLKKLTPIWVMGALRFRLSEIRLLIQRGTV